MREIKFRVFDKISKQMYRWSQIASISLIDFNKEHYELMQFTGLTDKNGVEIYEGDIVNSSYFKKGIVVFWENGWYFEVSGNSHHSFNTARHSFEIIGNIHSNPELL